MIRLFIRLFVCLSIYLFVCLFVYLYNFNRFLLQSRDSGINGFVTFSLSTNPDDTFSISDVIGTFSLRIPLDFEETTQYHVVVVATDSGINPLTTETSISITVTDSDDLTPVFDMTSYYVAIEEHSTSGKCLWQLWHLKWQIPFRYVALKVCVCVCLLCLIVWLSVSVSDTACSLVCLFVC